MTIKSYRSKATAKLFADGTCPDAWKPFKSVAARKLDMLDAAVRLSDLASPPGNSLEKLRDDRAGQHSIRINKQWRICFEWTDDGPTEVEIVDYH